MSHKYIRKIPNSKGGYYYIYPKDFAKPMKVLLSIFGMKEEKIDDSYKNNNIQEVYGVNKQGYAAHLLEYLSNKGAWNKFFSDKFNRDRYKVPVKTESKKTEEKTKVSESEIKNNGKTTDKTNKEHNETKEKDFKSKWNNSLMRKIYSMYNPIPEDKKVETTQNSESGDKVSFNGKVGVISQDFGNGMVFVKFDNGGMGRFKKTDLQLLNPSNQEVANEADAKGDEIKENDPTLNTSNDTVAEVTTEYENKEVLEKNQKINDFENNAGFMLGADTRESILRNMSEYTFGALENHLKDFKEKITPYTLSHIDETIETWNEKINKEKLGLVAMYRRVERDYLVSLKQKDKNEENIENQSFTNAEKTVIALAYKNEKNFDPTLSDYAYYEKIKAKMPELAEKGSILSVISEIKDKDFSELDLQGAKEYLENINKPHGNETAMLGNQNAKKNNNSEIAALENYASGDGMWVNNYLRNPSLYESESGVLNETDKQFIADLDNATTTETITDKKLYRAVDASAVFGNISDLDFENLQASVVYGNKEKLYADKVDSLINGAMNKEITEKGFMSTTKDEEIAANWDGFTGSNKEVVMELNIPDGLTGKDMKDFDVEGDEQKEVLLPRNLDYKVTEITKGKNGKILVKADVLGVHGNHIAMLGNQNARKQGYTDLKRKEVENNLKPKIGKYTNESTGIEANFTGASIDKMSSSKAIEKSKANGFTVDEHFEVVNNILQLWKDAKLVETRPDKNGSTNLLSIKRFDADTVLSSGKNAVAHITVKESVQHGHKIYSVEVIDIEQKNNGQENPNRFNGGAELNQTSTSNENNITETKNVNTDTSKLSEAMKGNQNARKDGLTDDEAEALEYYVQDAGYTYVNQRLNHNEKLTEKDKEVMKLMDSAIDKNTVKEKTLYRGTGGDIYFPTLNPYEHRLMELKLNKPDAYDMMPNSDWFDAIKYDNAKDNVEKYLSNIVGKKFTNKGYTSTSKDFDNTKTFAVAAGMGVYIEFQNIPDNQKGIDLSNFDGGREFRAENEVLLPRDLSYKITGIKGVDGKTVLTAEIIPESDAEKTQNRSESMMGNDNAKGKHNVKPQTESEMKKEQKKEKEARKKAGLKVPNEELGERSSAIEDVDIQNNEFTDTEESTKEELKKEVKAPSNQVQKDAFNELAAARYELAKKNYGISFYGRMNNKLKSTDEEVVAAQKRYDEVLAKYNSLMGSDNTDFSYNPNAENYAYRDTGYIAGSQKEKIAQFWADVQERGGGVKLEDIDWVALEENLRYAESKIVKSNILKKPDFEVLRESGMSGGAAYFYNRLIDCIPTKPAENTPEGHRNYVRAINTFQDRMEKCKTVREMAQQMNEIADEMLGRYVGADKTPEVIEIQKQIDELKEWRTVENKQFSDAKVNLWNIPLVKDFTENNTSFVRQAYGKPYPFALPGLSSSKDSKLQVNFMTFLSNNDRWYTFMKENEKELMKYTEFRTYKEILDKSTIVERNRYYQNRDVLLPNAKKTQDLEKQKKDIIQKINDDYMFNSAEHKMWSAFGDKYESRFSEYMRSASDFNNFIYRGNKTILGHYENANRGKFDDWEWLPKKEENSVSGEKKERKESFQLLVATEHERKGGKDVSVKTTQELKEMFNLRDIQSGEWVLKDPKSAKWHIDRCCEGFSDLCDITGIPENLVSLNGRLALAIGARGHKGALAHYEPVERVINITKMHGGGSLAHEWFHSFDNLLSEAMLGGDIDAWLTKPGSRGFKDAPDTVIPEVKQAFTNLVDAMKKGDNPVMKPVDVTETDKKNPDKVLRSVLYYRNYGYGASAIYTSVMKSTTFEEANKILMDNFKNLTSYNGRFNSTKVRDFQKAQKAIAAKFGKDKVNVFTGETASNFFIAAWNLDDGGKKGYWSTTHEMAARAFSGFVGDNLRKAGRINTYLTSHDTNDAYPSWAKPNPEGEERERINQAFKELFDVIKSTNAIRKAINMLDDFIQKSAEPRFIIKGGRFLVKK